MRNAFIILTAAVLMAGAVFAQEKSESVESIFKELTTYSAPTPAPQAAPTPVAEVAPVAEVETAPSITEEPEPAVTVQAAPADAPKSSGRKFRGTKEKNEASADVAVAMPDEDVPAATMVEEVHEEIPVNEFVQSQQGIPDVIQSAPENIAARLYRRTLLERDHRAVEVEGMNEVKAAWSTKLVLRSYALASGARERMKLEEVTSAVDVGALFPLVDFPKDSSAIYQPDTETIFVRNTQQNLAVFETILETMGVLKNSGGGTQVEIEAKFVEVSEGTLEELGFQWNFDGTVRTGIEGSDVNQKCARFGWASGALAATMLTDYAQPADEEQLWSIWNGNARVKR
jgi:type II secretory pathway component GspD/PulD (secretin)